MRRNYALFTGMTGGMTMRSLLIKDTTKEERMAIIEESVGGDAGGCDGCSAGILKMYEPYIEGEWNCENAIWRFVHIIFRGRNIRRKTDAGICNV